MLQQPSPNLLLRELAPEPKLENPAFIVGLPGMAHVAKLSADYLVETLGAKPFLQILSPAFPPYIVSRDGIAEPTKNELYWWKGKPRDLVIYTGNTQPENSNPNAVRSHYEIAEGVMDIAQRLGVSRVIATAAYVMDRPVAKPRVWAVATDAKTLDEVKGHGVVVMRDGGITGLNGLILGVAKTRSIPGVCLLGETTNPQVEDPRAARAVLEVVSKLIPMKLDLADLEKRAQKREKALKERESLERKMVEELLKAKQGASGEPPPDYIR
ncbi:MAG: PAC2 family protein [Euryarchaeota archaeon]|nr:PAC2 family protein [Euryarchaeota archaeon]